MQLFSTARNNFNIRSLIGFAISFILLWLTIRQSGLEWNNITLSVTQWYYFAGAMASFMVSVWLQSVRAKFIWMDGGRKFRDIDTYSGFIVGNLYNCIIPANLGDGVRAYHFSKKHGVTFSRSLAAIVTEKLLDAWVFIIYGALLFVCKPFVPNTVSYVILYVGLGAIGFWVLLGFMLRYKKLEKTLWIPVWYLAKKPGRFLYRLYRQTTNHLQELHRKKMLVYYIVMSLIAFAVNMVQFMLLMKVVGIQEPLYSLYTGILISAGSMVLVFIPSAPSNLGILHYGTYLILLFAAELYHVVPSPENLQKYALFGVYMHLSFFIPEIILGIIFLIKERNWVFRG